MPPIYRSKGSIANPRTQSGYGTRLIPDGTIQGAHFVQTPDYVQVTGTGLPLPGGVVCQCSILCSVLGIGDLTKINVPAGDAGGELDPHGADGNGKARLCLTRLFA